MNGSENGYAGALFFALISLCGAWQIGDIEGLIFGGVGALFAAISLRMALNKSAQAAEEDHQRMKFNSNSSGAKLSRPPPRVSTQ
ncbi:MAG: hypothetical protein IKZ53_06285 [Selenomonadaceae bacterium]|nr:hypothetical protein [Selenomonadaceae bacterium]